MDCNFLIRFSNVWSCLKTAQTASLHHKDPDQSASVENSKESFKTTAWHQDSIVFPFIWRLGMSQTFRHKVSCSSPDYLTTLFVHITIQSRFFWFSLLNLKIYSCARKKCCKQLPRIKYKKKLWKRFFLWKLSLGKKHKISVSSSELLIIHAFKW